MKRSYRLRHDVSAVEAVLVWAITAKPARDMSKGQGLGYRVLPDVVDKDGFAQQCFHTLSFAWRTLHIKAEYISAHWMIDDLQYRGGLSAEFEGSDVPQASILRGESAFPWATLRNCGVGSGSSGSVTH